MGFGFGRRVSGTDAAQGLRWDVVEFTQDTGYQRRQVPQPVADSIDNKDGNRQRGEILLKLQVPIHGEEDIEPGCGEREKFAVFDA